MESLLNLATTATTTLMDLADVFSDKANVVAAQTTASGKDIWFSFLGIDWSSPTWDLVILLFFLISVLVYSFTLGRDRIVAILLSTYIALAITTNLPFMDRLTDLINRGGIFTFQISSFLIVFAVLFFLLTRGNIIQGLSSLSGSWWQIILFSFLQVGLLTSIILSFLPDSALGHLSEFTKIVFLSDIGRFVWMVLPILALAFFKGKRSRFDF